MNKYRKDTTVNISKTAKAELVAYLDDEIKIGPWVEKAIKQRMELERTGNGNVVLERQGNSKEETK